ncbi:MAG: helix-turn-helix domain-containing protein, partial [Shimia sp.]|nr:helix-turn-helix domain-containing protein [Shimia sp.]
FQMLAYVLATESLRLANKCAGRELFTWQTRTATNVAVQASNGALVAPDTVDWEDRPKADLILFCAGYHPLDHLTARVRAYASRKARGDTVIGGVDTGSVILAELGLLDGARAVLHHEAGPAFRERWPDITLSDQIFCLDDRRLTAAGGTATGDAMLAWIAREVGEKTADAVAVDMIHGGRRSSETPQVSSETADPVLTQMHQMMVESLPSPMPIAEVCSALGLSEKQLRRRCRAVYGVTPSAYYQKCRLENAHFLIANSQLSITDIAIKCGFEALPSFSRAFRAAYDLTPMQLRQRSSKGSA